jgi:hypothetical protein
MKYGDKEDNVKFAKQALRNMQAALHPEDAVEALHKLETYAGERATQQAEINEREGVPEKPQPVESEDI